MKKYLALLLAAIMALSLAACASTAKTEDAASTSGKLTMATEATFQPYEYYDGDAIVGIDVEVAQAIADKLAWSWKSPTSHSTPSSPACRPASMTWACRV